VTLEPPYTVGTKAIVVAVGSICAQSTCVLNANPHLGVPPSSAGFAAAYEAAATRMSIGYAVFACLQAGSAWYVDLGLATHS
jgi:hypothetical protein